MMNSHTEGPDSPGADRSAEPQPDESESTATPALPSLPRRFLMVIVSPVELFRILRERPVALGPLILGALLVGASAALIPIEVLEDTLRRQMLEMGQEIEGGLTMIARVTWVTSIFGPLIFWPLTAVLTAGVYSAIFKFAFGWEGRFRQYFSVAAHALLVVAFGMLLVAPLRALSADPQLALSVGSFFGFLPEGIVLGFLQLLDLFNLWSYVLVGLGAATIDRSRSLRSGVLISVGAALLVTLVIAAIMA